MATYKEIKGVTVQSLDEDPVTAGGSWSSGGDVNSARTHGGGAGNSNSANLFIGGQSPPGNTTRAYTEEWNATAGLATITVS